jgi:hypothetical protein
MSEAKVCGGTACPAEDLRDGQSVDVVKAVADEFAGIGGSGEDEIPNTDRFGDLRHSGLERLLGSRECEAAQALGLEDLALGTLADDRHDHVHADLRGFLHEPLIAVEILGRADRHRQVVGMGAETVRAFQHARPGAPGLGQFQHAAVERATAVDHRDLVALAVAQHPHAMGGLVRVQPDLGILDIV